MKNNYGKLWKKGTNMLTKFVKKCDKQNLKKKIGKKL